MNRGELLEKLKLVPKSPGVYIFKNTREKILYVGKAKSLKNRLSSYFQKGSNLDQRKASMVEHVRDFSFIVTESELEAFVLEANLIKQFKPNYNIILRDDKNYPYIRVTMKEDWPRVDVVRGIKKDGSAYFGPYIPAGPMWEAFGFIQKNFDMRPCRYKLDKPLRPCIEYQMKRCPAPCAGLITRKEYMKNVRNVVMFLRGRKRGLLNDLERKMKRLADELRYEEAAKVRDRINFLQHIWESQKVVAPEIEDADVISHYGGGDNAVFQVLFIRNGLMIGAKDFHLRDVGGITLDELYHDFLMMFYSKDLYPPAEIFIAHMPEESGEIVEWLFAKWGRKVRIFIPSAGKKAELVAMATENARAVFIGKTGRGDVLVEMKERLGLDYLPRSIGAFDVSNISGTEAVGAYINWVEGEFDKDNYRHVKIKTVDGADDFAMMAETVSRVMDSIAPSDMPDLIVIDGGKGQLDYAYDALTSLPAVLYDNPAGHIISIAKDPDRVFMLSLVDPVEINDKAASSLLLRKIRDEVHRFAIGFHRQLRAKRVLESPLEKIKGISKKRRLSLIKKFGSLQNIKDATVEELSATPGMNRKIAEALKAELDTAPSDLMENQDPEVVK